VPTKWSVSGVGADEAGGIAAWAVAQGFRTLKVKVGIEADADASRVRAVRGAAGPNVRIGVDANGGWHPASAIAAIERFYEDGIYFVEQPVAAWNLSGMADVRRRIRVPVIADESVFTPDDAAAAIESEAADVLSVYIGKAGGIGPARRIVELAEAAGVACTVGSNLEMGVGSAAMIHFALATPGVKADEFPCDIIGPLYYEEDLLTIPLRIGGGTARALDGPGLGVELDDEKVRRYEVK
jgi:muconate cycloisomerase